MAQIHDQTGAHTLNIDAQGRAAVTLEGIATLDDGNGGQALSAAIAATNFIASVNNSTATQLAAGATFTGTIESIFNQQSISVLLTSDQNGTLVLNQYIDINGLRKTNTWTYAVTAGVPFSRSFTANGNFFNLTFQNTGGSSTTTLNINTAYGTLTPADNAGNMPVSMDEVGGVALTLGQKVRASSIPVVDAAQATYMASFSGAVTAAAATDVFTINGSASKTVKVLGLYISGTQNTAGIVAFQLIKRSTADTGGTSTTPTAVPLDSSDAAATAVVRAYTANPTLGTAVGTLLTASKLIPPANFANSDVEPLYINFTARGMKEVVLRGAAQGLSINLNAAGLTGNSLNFSVVWTEE